MDKGGGGLVRCCIWWCEGGPMGRELQAEEGLLLRDIMSDVQPVAERGSGPGVLLPENRKEY